MVSKKIELIESKNGLPVLQVEHEGKIIMIHSKYDPVKEAKQIIDKHKDDIGNVNHVLFYGIGLGYHVKEFVEQYPEKIASTYEPIIEVAEECNGSVTETKLPTSELKYRFTEKEPEDLERHLRTLSTDLTQKVLVIILPSYERFLKGAVLRFLAQFKEIVEEKQMYMNMNTFLSKRWTMNSLMNLPSTFENPNFLLEYTAIFKDKPVILVAAGPSLSEEMENLRHIKDEGLAYIFAVGSANKALIEQGIHPDAVFTYDPQAHNYTVFQPIIDNEVKTIPLIYGTSVGFETLQHYPGPKFHFVTSQDTLTQLFHETNLPVINDAYSVAIVTLQLLYHLQVGKVILVGQNFAFKNDLFYSKEIKRYDWESKELSDAAIQKADLEDSFYVEDVQGNQILTNKALNLMRQLVEKYIKANPQIPVVNSTRGGAAIAGTKYVSLRQLVKEELLERVVMEGWYEKGTALPLSAQSSNKLKVLQKDTVAFIGQYDKILTFVHELEHTINHLKGNQLQKRLEMFDEMMRKLMSNMLYDIVIRPITRNEFEKLQIAVEVIRKQTNIKKKIISFIELFMPYLQICLSVYKEVAPIIQTVVFPAFLKGADKKELIATSGVFQYEGEWEKWHLPKEQMPVNLTAEEQGEWYEQKRLEDKIDLPITSVRTTEKNASFTFRFSGTSLCLYGTNYSTGVLKLKIIIDNKISNITIKDHIDKELYGSFIRQQLFQTTNLKEDMYHVTIEVISDNPNFLFQGVEIDKYGRAYHVHEVMAIDELEVGKRIRCHYEATYNTVGEFSRLGEEIDVFLLIEASAQPNGDFYFIMVDEIDGEKKLIADRNVQNQISWVRIQDGFGKTHFNKNLLNSFINMPTGGDNAEDKNNDWDCYIAKTNFSVTKKPNDEHYWNCIDGITSWCLNKTREFPDRVAIRGKYFGAGKWWGENGHYWSASGSVFNKWASNGFRPVLTLEISKKE